MDLVNYISNLSKSNDIIGIYTILYVKFVLLLRDKDVYAKSEEDFASLFLNLYFNNMQPNGKQRKREQEWEREREQEEKIKSSLKSVLNKDILNYRYNIDNDSLFTCIFHNAFFNVYSLGNPKNVITKFPTEPSELYFEIYGLIPSKPSKPSKPENFKFHPFTQRYPTNIDYLQATKFVKRYPRSKYDLIFAFRKQFANNTAPTKAKARNYEITLFDKTDLNLYM